MFNVDETDSTRDERNGMTFFCPNTKQYTSVNALRGHNIGRRYTTTQGRDELRKSDDSANETMKGKGSSLHGCTTAAEVWETAAGDAVTGAEDVVTERDLISSTSPCDDTINWTHKHTNRRTAVYKHKHTGVRSRSTTDSRDTSVAVLGSGPWPHKDQIQVNNTDVPNKRQAIAYD